MKQDANPVLPIPDLENRTTLRLQEFSRLFQVTTQHVINLIESGTITAIDCASTGTKSGRTTWRIPVGEVYRFAAARSNIRQPQETAIPSQIPARSSAGGTKVPPGADLRFAMGCTRIAMGSGGGSKRP
jgi:hypothetical protein